MIEHILRLFPSYRYLLEAHADKLRLQDQLQQERGERERIWELLQATLASKDEFIKVERNAMYQTKYGFKPHPEYAGIPDAVVAATQESKPGAVGGRLMAIDEQAQNNKKFMEEYETRVRNAVAAQHSAKQ